MAGMGLLRSDAVVLQTYPLSETDRIVIAYTRKYGKLRGVARGARRIRSPFSGRLEPFHWIEFCGHEKENQELIKIDKAELISAFSLGLQNYRCFLQFNVLAELLLKTVPEREPNEPLFRLLLLVLPEMRNPHRSDLAQLYFEIWHLRLAGLFPACRSCCRCDLSLLLAPQVSYSSLFHGFCCSRCKQGSCYLLSSESYRLLYMMLRKPLEEIFSSEVGAWQSGQDELSRAIEALLQENFERSLDCLQLVHSES
jgi:DNA repair protein RecO (recombination protein O)